MFFIKNMRVCLGGTFNIFHKGHKKLIDIAFQTAGKNGYVFIGLIKGNILKKKKFVIPYKNRVNAIKKYIKSKGYNQNFEIMPIYDKYGLAVDEDFDSIIVSQETLENANEINQKRILKDKKPLDLIKIPMILANDNKPISSTRIFNKEIDEEGNIIKK